MRRGGLCVIPGAGIAIETRFAAFLARPETRQARASLRTLNYGPSAPSNAPSNAGFRLGGRLF